MAILSQTEAQDILKKVLSFSTADECEANLSGSLEGNVRSARNTISTSGATDNVALAVTSYFGKKSGTATCNQFDEATLKRCVQRAEEIARLAPESPEYMPLLGAQQYLSSPLSFAQNTADITPDFQASQMGETMNYCTAQKLTSAGFLNHRAGFTAKRNSKGLEAYQRLTNLDFSITVRTPDGTGSGYAATDFTDIKNFNAKTLATVAAGKAKASVGARAPRGADGRLRCS
jgi:predicted Zn-dependent protease